MSKEVIGSIESLFTSDQHSVMELVNPKTGDFLKNSKGDVVSINLTSKDSPACKAVTASFRNRFKKSEPSASAFEKFSIELLAAATVGWSNFINSEGEEIKFSVEEAKRIYYASVVIRNQVDEFVGADENFLQSA